MSVSAFSFLNILSTQAINSVVTIYLILMGCFMVGGLLILVDSSLQSGIGLGAACGHCSGSKHGRTPLSDVSDQSFSACRQQVNQKNQSKDSVAADEPEEMGDPLTAEKQEEKEQLLEEVIHESLCYCVAVSMFVSYLKLLCVYYCNHSYGENSLVLYSCPSFFLLLRSLTRNQT
ncbi:hypothetical protein DCAR_0312973 [Daucus carota subsp. sativus]|uniref:Uncharacterized protein n=1 Tax=Daucus carota subsp. sativus TaxID=79200 RepID=A0A161Y0Q6_DAUCS|nr:hypothetical protein DCAR_0312973 [Daucus carota subsp. sativus]